jgi:hypothetical protein
MSIYEDREGSGGANEVAIGLPLEAGHEGGLDVERLVSEEGSWACGG